jgi:hypothetical protein
MRQERTAFVLTACRSLCMRGRPQQGWEITATAPTGPLRGDEPSTITACPRFYSLICRHFGGLSLAVKFPSASGWRNSTACRHCPCLLPDKQIRVYSPINTGSAMVKPNENRLFPPLHHHARAQFDCVLIEALPDAWNHIVRQIREHDVAPLPARDNQASEQPAARHKRG